MSKKTEDYLFVWDEKEASELLNIKAALPGALLPVLNALHDRFGFVQSSFIPRIAKRLHLSEAEVHGVISFYSDYRYEPPKKYLVKVCRAEACQAMSRDDLITEVEKFKDVTVEPVYCLGNCACAPSVMVNDKIQGRVTAEKLKDILS